jgi:hypothetical protein
MEHAKGYIPGRARTASAGSRQLPRKYGGSEMGSTSPTVPSTQVQPAAIVPVELPGQSTAAQSDDVVPTAPLVECPGRQSTHRMC